MNPVIRDAATGKVVRRFIVPEEAAKKETVKGVSLSPDGLTLTTIAEPVSASAVSFAVRRDVATGRVIDRTERPGDRLAELMSPAAVSPDGRWRVENGLARRVGGDEKIVVAPRIEAERGSMAARFSADSRLVFVPTAPERDRTDRGRLVVYDIVAKAQVTDLPTGRALRFAVSPDGRRVAVVGREEISVWEVAGGQAVRRLRAEHGGTLRRGAIAFTPDGRRLVTGMDDCTALVWDLTGTCRASATGAPPLTTEAAAALWADMAGPDAGKVDTAVWELSDRPGPAVALIEERIKPAAAADEVMVKRLLTKLNSDDFADRDAAEKTLRGLGDSAIFALRAALAGTPSPEQKERLERLLAAAVAPVPPDAESLRAVRAVAVLERAGTLGAREVLRRLAGGLDGARLTREAKEAWARLGGK